MTHSAKYSKSNPHGIMFHHFHGQGHPTGQGSISQEDFAEMIDFLGRDRILSAEDWLERAEAGRLREGDLCITFDDNLRCQYDIAYPVLKARGIRAFWFIYTSVLEGKTEPLEIYRYFRSTHFSDVEDFYSAFFESVEKSEFASLVNQALIGFVPENYLKEFSFYTVNDRKFRFVRDQVLGVSRYNQLMDGMVKAAGLQPASLAEKLWMNRTHIQELDQAGHFIGLHSHSHPTALAKLSPADQKAEYETNFARLTSLLGKEPVTASHPCNSYGPETLDILKGLNIRLAFRANMTAMPRPSILELPREDHALVLKEMRR